VIERIFELQSNVHNLDRSIPFIRNHIFHYALMPNNICLINTVSTA